MKRKILTLFTATAVLMPVLFGFSGCSKGTTAGKSSGGLGETGRYLTGSEREAEVLADDSIWYSRRDFEFEDPLGGKTEDIDGGSYSGVYEKDNEYYVFFQYYTTDWNMHCLSLKYDSEGRLLSKKDMSEYPELPEMKDGEGYEIYGTVGGYQQNFGKFIIKNAEAHKVFLYDIVSGDLNELGFLGSEFSNDFSGISITSDGTIYITVEEYRENQDTAIRVYATDGRELIDKLDLNELLSTYGKGEIYMPEFLGNVMETWIQPDGKAFDEAFKVRMDLKTKELKRMNFTGEDPMSRFDSAVFLNGKKYVVRDDGVYSADADGNEKDELLFENCNYDERIGGYRDLTAVSDDKMVFVGSDRFRSETIPGLSATVLTKCDKNPNVGKQVLRLAYFGNSDMAVSVAVARFNENNGDYFIKTDRKYMGDVGGSSFGGIIAFADDGEEGKLDMVGKSADLTNELAMDLISGTGPDIIIGAHQFVQLQNDDCLMDLSEFYSNEIPEGTCFDNIVSLAERDGKLYGIPTSFTVNGLMVTDDVSKPSGSGYTYEEYQKIVKEDLNGYDPCFFGGKLDSMIYLINSQYDLFYGDGKLDFDNDAFLTTAGYVRDHVFDGWNTEVEFDEADWDKAHLISYCPDFETYANYADLGGGKMMTLYGLPSYDGRGYIADISSSISVSSSCGSKDGALAFIKDYISDETQEAVSEMAFNNSININVCEKDSVRRLEKINHERELMRKGELSVSGNLVKADMAPLPDDAVTSYMNILKKADHTNLSDPAIEKIIREEIPAFFAGQKTIEEVAETIRNRANTVISERG